MRFVLGTSDSGEQSLPFGLLVIINAFCFFWTYYSTVKPPCSNFRVITAKFLGDYSKFLGDYSKVFW